MQALALPSESGFAPLVEQTTLTFMDSMLTQLSGFIEAVSEVRNEIEIEHETPPVIAEEFSTAPMPLWEIEIVVLQFWRPEVIVFRGVGQEEASA